MISFFGEKCLSCFRNVHHHHPWVLEKNAFYRFSPTFDGDFHYNSMYGLLHMPFIFHGNRSHPDSSILHARSLLSMTRTLVTSFEKVAFCYLKTHQRFYSINIFPLFSIYRMFKEVSPQNPFFVAAAEW